MGLALSWALGIPCRAKDARPLPLENKSERDTWGFQALHMLCDPER